MTVGDKIRPWRTETCRHPDCDYTSKAEFDWLRHMDENPGHSIGPTSNGRPVQGTTGSRCCRYTGGTGSCACTSGP